MDLSIRPVRPDDAAEVARILNAVIEAGAYTVLTTPYSAEEEREFILRYPERGVFLVAESAALGRIVGFQDIAPYDPATPAFDHVAIIATYVDLELRRQGIGRRLAEATFAAARAKGYEKILTYVRADNPAALAFYRGLGFRVVGTAERQARLGGRYVDEVFIEKLL